MHNDHPAWRTKWTRQSPPLKPCLNNWARAAIDAFFSQTNLNALRELAMQTAAAHVDDDLAQGYRQLGQAAPAVRGRLLVGVDGDAQAER